jgi:hypothetical protein
MVKEIMVVDDSLTVRQPVGIVLLATVKKLVRVA